MHQNWQMQLKQVHLNQQMHQFQHLKQVQQVIKNKMPKKNPHFWNSSKIQSKKINTHMTASYFGFIQAF